MKICVVGGGPGGLYFSISVKRKMPSAEVVLFERNSPESTFGWGVVVSGRTQETLWSNDSASAERLSAAFVEWDTIEVILENQSASKSGYPFFGIDRRKLLNILTARCLELGVDVRFGQCVLPNDPVAKSFDLVVAADGVNSSFRSDLAAELGAIESWGSNQYIWLGTKTVFDKFRFVFKRSGAHWIWAHAYPFNRDTSTFIVECSQSAWEEAGFGEMDTYEGCRKLERLFSETLAGQTLLTNGGHQIPSKWDRFRQVSCRRWSTENIVLIGDAAHTIHFSVGSGTKQAFDDAICLTNSLIGAESVSEAINTYQVKRMQELSKLQANGERSMRWFEKADSYAEKLEVIDFERALLNRATGPDKEEELSATSN